jgi:uncharacterized repeat protein (TIGR01451 family)
MKTWLRNRFIRRPRKPVPFSRRTVRPRLDVLEDRTLPSATILPSNNGGNGWVGQTIDDGVGGYWIPPDTQGAAGPSSYVQTANLKLSLFTGRDNGTGKVEDSFVHFMQTVGGLPDNGGFFSDPIVCYDEQIGRYILGVQQTQSGPNAFDIATSKSSNPTTLTAADWNFYQLVTTEGTYFADYPGNFGYNADAFVVTFNMFGASDHVQVNAINVNDLASGNPSPQMTQTDMFGTFSVRPTTMHNSSSGDPMWLVAQTGDGSHINVWRMDNPLTAPTFNLTTVAVDPYFGVVAPLNPDGSAITFNIDSRIQKVSYNIVGGTPELVAAHAVSNAAGDRDLIQWYRMVISGGAPSLVEQGQVDSGPGTYNVYPALDITSTGKIGMDYTHSGTDSATDFMSGYVTGRLPSDPAGTMQSPVLIPDATGKGNEQGGREGDMSAINIDPVDGTTFWGTQEWAYFSNDLGTYYWAESAVHWDITAAASATHADLYVLGSGPSSGNEGDKGTFSFTVVNNGPTDTASGVTLNDFLDSRSKFVSATTNQGSFTVSGNQVTFNIGTLKPGAFVNITVTVQWTEDGSQVNMATVAANNNIDPTPGDDAAAESTAVAEPAIVVSAPVIVPAVTHSVTSFTAATFSHAKGVEPAGDFTATIDWGDGTTSAGTITKSGTQYVVKGSHTFVTSGAHTVTTTVAEIINVIHPPPGVPGGGGPDDGVRLGHGGVLPSSSGTTHGSVGAPATGPSRSAGNSGTAVSGNGAPGLTPPARDQFLTNISGGGGGSSNNGSGLL